MWVKRVGQQEVLNVLKISQRPLTINEISALTGTDRNTVHMYMYRLVKKEDIWRNKRRGRRGDTYRLIRKDRNDKR